MRPFGKLFPQEKRYSLTEYIDLLSDPAVTALQQTYAMGSKVDSPPPEFMAHVLQHMGNGPVYALNAFRVALFSQVRWCYQQLRNGQGGDLFSAANGGTLNLDTLNTDPLLNMLMMSDVNLAGNFYGRIEDGKVYRMRPDWVDILGDGPLEDYDTNIVGVAYYPGGKGRTRLEDAEIVPMSEVLHWFEAPDPQAPWRGMSWMTPIAREVQADTAATSYKNTSYEHGATPNMIIKYDPTVSFENFKKAKDSFAEEYEGVRNASKTLHIGGGADATVVGSNFQQADYRAVQGAGETRLAAAARVHPVVVGFSEGMQGASLNAGNFGMARRSTAEGLLHPLWVSAAGAIGEKFTVPAAARIWYDARSIPFLREDALDDAEIKNKDAVTIRQLVDSGWEPESIKAAMTAGDWSLLTHTGLYSVQLQPPMTSVPASDTASRSLKIVRDDHGFIAEVVPEVAGMSLANFLLRNALGQDRAPAALDVALFDGGHEISDPGYRRATVQKGSWNISNERANVLTTFGPFDGTVRFDRTVVYQGTVIVDEKLLEGEGRRAGRSDVVRVRVELDLRA